MFTAIYPELHRNYPNLDVRPIEMRVRAQQEAIARGEVDVGLMTLRSIDRTIDTYYPLKKEELVLMIPAAHPLAEKAAAPGEPLATMDLTALRYEPFVLMDKSSTLRSACDTLFEKAGFVPNILFETNNTGGIAAMVQSTLCCGIIPRYYTLGLGDGVACFSLPERPAWEIAICCQKHGYLNSGAREFIRLAREYWENSAPLY